MRLRYLQSIVLTSILSCGIATAATVPPTVPVNQLYPSGIGFNPVVDYSKANFSQSPNIRKFIDKLPGLGAPGCTVSAPFGTGTCNENNLGQYIPIAAPDTTSYANSDYYELGLSQYNKQMHSDLSVGGALLCGYYQKNGSDHSKQYLGPAIVAHKDRAVRIKFFNELGKSTSASNPNGAGDLPLPVDTTVMGAGMSPLTPTGAACTTGMGCAQFTQNRANLHLHGGLNPWISDGTPHQWITPAGDPTVLKKGTSFQNVPDMINGSIVNGKSIACIGGTKCFTPSNSDGIGTYYYTNQQSSRLMFYHDHAWGITRLNVYAGEAAPYIITSQVEEDLLTGTNVSGGNPAATQILPDLGGAYHYGIPLVIQDRSFVNDASVPSAAAKAVFPATATGYIHTPPTLTTDPLWQYYAGVAGGNFWFPHEYLPVQNIFDPTGNTPTGRWDYAAFMQPPMVPMNLTLPSPTIVPEAYGDTMIVNGTAFPYLELPPEAIRFRILNASNDRVINLQAYKADPLRINVTNGGSNYSAVPNITITGNSGSYTSATATVVNGAITQIIVIGAANYRSDQLPPTINISDISGAGATAVALVNTEVKMVDASPNSAFPSWPRDGRPGGVPDPTSAAPPWVQIGNETGFLAQAAIWPQQPIDYEYNRQTIPFAGVNSHALLLMPAMRADVVIDLSGYKDGDTLIVYNDAPAPMPMWWPLNDYYTDDPDQTSTGGAVTTPPGFGPNTRTVMQIRIKGTKTSSYNFNLATLQAAIPKAFAIDQPKPLVPQMAYNAAFPGFATADTYAQGPTVTLNMTGAPQPVAKIKTMMPGNNYTAPKVTVVGNCSSVPTATAGLNPCGGITLLTSGAGYTTTPTVTIGSPASTYTAPTVPAAGAVQATAFATVSGGIVNSIMIDEPGSNYNINPLDIKAIPTCAISAPPCTINTTTCIQATCSAFTATAKTVGSITVTNPGLCTSQPLAFITDSMMGMGMGATAEVLISGSLIMTGKNLTEGFDPDYGRMDVRLGSTPNPLTPSVGNGMVVGIARYIDPPTEILNDGETILWRLAHLGVDSHVMHFHLFDVQVVNRVDWTNVVKPPYPDEIGWRETIRTNPMEDIIVAIRPKSMSLPFPLPDSIRVLDPTTPVNSTMNFLPVVPPVGIPVVPQLSNVVTNFGWEYVWHCHLLGHEENDMMRPIALIVTLPSVPTGLSAAVTYPTSSTAQVVLKWTPVGTNSRGFVIQRSTSNAFPVGASTVSFTIDGSNVTNALTDTSVNQNTTYYYRVQATNAAGATGWSGTLTVLTVVPPTSLAGIVTTGAGTDSVNLTWSASGAPTSFTIQRMDFNTGVVSYTIAGTARSFTQAGLVKGSTYYYRIRTNVTGGSSAYSPEILIIAP